MTDRSNKIAPLIDPERIRLDADLNSKKRALEVLSELLADAQPNLTTEEIFACLIRRERLGTTGVGHGIAIPHGRLQGLEKPVGAMLSLRHGVDFLANDEQPVDLLFAMLVPEDANESHLEILAALAEMFTDEQFTAKVRQCGSVDDATQLLSSYQTDQAA